MPSLENELVSCGRTKRFLTFFCVTFKSILQLATHHSFALFFSTKRMSYACCALPPCQKSAARETHFVSAPLVGRAVGNRPTLTSARCLLHAEVAFAPLMDGACLSYSLSSVLLGRVEKELHYGMFSFGVLHISLADKN